MFSEKERERYDRHFKLNGFGEAAQLRLKKSRVLLIGAGGLGCPIGLYLAAAGVGKIRLCDFDTIDLTNLQRQIAHHTKDVGKSKTESLAQQMSAINDDIEVEKIESRFSADNASSLLEDVDLVIDGSDNFSTRYLVADACFLGKKPLVYGAIHQFEGQVSLFPANGPCYRCLFPEAPTGDAAPNCSEAGVLGVLPGTIGLLMANEALKFLAEVGQTLAQKLLLFDALSCKFQTLRLGRDPQCALCGDHPSIHRLEEQVAVCVDENLELSLDAAKLDHEAGMPFLDVRESLERKKFAIHPSDWIPLDQISEMPVPYAFNEKFIVYCARGVRSLQAVKKLREMGYSQCKSMTGGALGWQSKFGEK